jgi:tRNA(adenine34) deaminase
VLDATARFDDDARLMQLAIDEARAALAHHERPDRDVVVRDGRIIAARHNERELTQDPTAHAELLALRDAAVAVGSWRLDGCTLVVTLEPCVMCAGAAHLARVDRVVFGAVDIKAGALGSLYNVGTDARLNHEFTVTGGVLTTETSELLIRFFGDRRA